MNKEDIKSSLEKILEEKLFIVPTEFLFESLDSLQVINLIVALEESFGIRVEISDVSADQWGNAESLLQYICNSNIKS